MPPRVSPLTEPPFPFLNIDDDIPELVESSESDDEEEDDSSGRQMMSNRPPEEVANNVTFAKHKISRIFFFSCLLPLFLLAH